MAESQDVLDFVATKAGIRAAVEGRMTAALTAVATSGSTPEQIRDAMAAVSRRMVAEYGQAAAEFAADWYNDLRLIANVPGSYAANPYTRDYDEQIDATVRRAVGTLWDPEPDIEGMVNAIVSKASQYTLDGARHTVVRNSNRDPQSRGWRRVPRGKTCDFCLMLVGRGGVYKKSTVEFRSHTNCDCGCVPSWDLNAVEVPNSAYLASARNEALRKRAKEKGPDDEPTKDAKNAQRQLDNWRERVNDYIERNQGEFAQLRQDFNLPPAA